MKKIKYVLIDDDEDDHLFFQMALNDISYSFEHNSFKNSPDGIDLLTNLTVSSPDYIFLDLNMPLIDGKKCLEKIKEMKHLHNSKVVIFTGSISKNDVDELSSLGANHYLIKPHNIKTLVQSLSYLFGDENPPFLINSEV